MITRDPEVFLGIARGIAPDPARATARAAFLVAPEQFQLAEQSASDNLYMDLAAGVDPARAAAQHRCLQQAMAATLPTLCFPGDARTPDAIFPNNVFATVAPRDGEPGRLVLGHMRHPVRQAEAKRADIRRFFAEVLGYRVWDLAAQPGICELTGSLVIDHARRIGYCGLSERCDATGAAAMHEAFGLRATLLFELARGEYHTNVVLSVLAGKAVVVAPDGFGLARVADAIADLYVPHVDALEGPEAGLRRQLPGPGPGPGLDERGRRPRPARRAEGGPARGRAAGPQRAAGRVGEGRRLLALLRRGAILTAP